jgi:hypothetical protein
LHVYNDMVILLNIFFGFLLKVLFFFLCNKSLRFFFFSHFFFVVDFISNERYVLRCFEGSLDARIVYHLESRVNPKCLAFVVEEEMYMWRKC